MSASLGISVTDAFMRRLTIVEPFVPSESLKVISGRHRPQSLYTPSSGGSCFSSRSISVSTPTQYSSGSVSLAYQEFDPSAYEDFEEKILGRGQFGIVYAVRSKETQNEYAIKVVNKDHFATLEKIQEAILREQNPKRFDNPFIIKIYSIVQDFLRFYVIMERVHGVALDRLISKTTPKEREGKNVPILAQIFDALSFLHDKGCIHRDLKSANIMLDEKGFIRIIDFGLCKNLEENTPGTPCIGTPGYMAPESLTSDYGKEEDLYAVGCIAHELFVGQLPNICSNDATRLWRLKRDLTPIQVSGEFISLEAKNFIEGLLIRNPHERLGSKGIRDEVMTHEFFKNIDFSNLETMRIPMP